MKDSARVYVCKKGRESERDERDERDKNIVRERERGEERELRDGRGRR